MFHITFKQVFYRASMCQSACEVTRAINKSDIPKLNNDTMGEPHQPGAEQLCSLPDLHHSRLSINF